MLCQTRGRTTISVGNYFVCFCFRSDQPLQLSEVFPVPGVLCSLSRGWHHGRLVDQSLQLSIPGFWGHSRGRRQGRFAANLRRGCRHVYPISWFGLRANSTSIGACGYLSAPTRTWLRRAFANLLIATAVATGVAHLGRLRTVYYCRQRCDRRAGMPQEYLNLFGE